jgi:hypothetical protein
VTHHDSQPSTPPVKNVQYKGGPLDAERGPGLGCFRFQVIVLGILIVLTPLSVLWAWPPTVSAVLLVVVILLLFLTGQTIIFLLRLVAADRRAAGRRRPLASATPTVGELEDRERTGDDTPEERSSHGDSPAADGAPADGIAPERESPPDEGSVRQ